MRMADRDPEVMLQVVLRIYGQKLSLPESMVICYHDEQKSWKAIQDFTGQLYEVVVAEQAVQRVPLVDNTVFRNYFIFQIRDAMRHMMLKERVIQDNTVSF
ncbi:hypothetical protein BsWGS_14116 [Bradybaena similaris]